MKNRKKYIVLLIILCLISMCINHRFKLNKRRKIMSEKILESLFEYLKINNVSVNKKNYEIKYIGCKNGRIDCLETYGVANKDIKYKSKYFAELNNKYYFSGSFPFKIEKYKFDFEHGGDGILTLINRYGLIPFVLNNFIYDKSKGNNFEEIEKIFDTYKKGTIKYYFRTKGWYCSGLEKISYEEGINFVKNKNCMIKISDYSREYNPKEVKKYSEKYIKYFSVPRQLETINWEEYMKIHEIYPVITFDTTLSYSEGEELKRKIEPYYNKEIMLIHILRL